MSLQGSLDTFALPDVLLLLATTKKSGELHVAGHRNPGGPRSGELQGLLWVTDGKLVGHEVASATDPATAVFELLRLQEGSFSFVSGAAPNPQPAVEIEPVLGEAQGYLTEWREIERVVPSLAAWLRLAPEAPAAHVSMRAEQWRIVVAVGGGCEVSSLVEHLGHGELGGCRAVKELAEAGLLQVTAEAAPGAIFQTAPAFGEPPPRHEATAAPADEPLAAPVAFGYDPADSTTHAFETGSAFQVHATEFEPTDGGFAPSPDADGGYASSALHEAAAEAANDSSEPASEESTRTSVTDFDSLVSLPSRTRKSRLGDPDTEEVAPRRTLSAVAGDSTGEPPSPGQLPEAKALARQLASLGEENGEPSSVAGLAPDADDADGDEPLNRGLLLKFLSSVRN